MSAALTVQPRHLSLPDACLVTPSQLSIPRSISKEDFLAVAAKLKALGQAEDFWLADAASFAKKWDDGLQLMAETVGRTKYHLERVAQIAERFTPAKRFSYTVAHLRAPMPFPDEFLDSFLHSAANLNLSVKALRARAETEFGSNPYKPKNPTKRSIPLRASLVAQLSERAPRKVSALVERICESWLEHQDAPNQTVGVAESDVPAPAATQPCPPNPSPTETPKPESQTETGRSGPKEYLDAEDGIHRLTDRPTYSQRRAQQIADGAEPISKRVGKQMKRTKRERELRLLWTTCGATFNGRAGSQRPDTFDTEQEAIEAEAQYARDHGYRNEVVQCLGSHQGCYHVRHSYSGDHFAAQKKSAQAISA